MSDERYWLFSGYGRYPDGGLDDLQGKFPTMDAAVVREGHDWAHLLDTATGARVDWHDGRWMTRAEINEAKRAACAAKVAAYERVHAEDQRAMHLGQFGVVWDGVRWVSQPPDEPLDTAAEIK